jgi:SAM-dependent methyltransferase
METRYNKVPYYILEVGAGQGTDAVLLSQNNGHVVAIDISLNALKTAGILAARVKNGSGIVSLVRADAENLPFKENSFDFVFCKDVLHHVTDPIGTVSEMKRVAALNTNLVALEANACNPQMILIGLIYYTIDKGVFRNTSSKLINFFVDAGLSNVRIKEAECLPRHMLFEYRSPIRRFFQTSGSPLFLLLQKVELNWQRHKTLLLFSNYLIVFGTKK